jgi:putative transcriptional regulator
MLKFAATAIRAPMNDAQPDYAALIMDYASGALPPAFRLLVDVHFDIRPEAKIWAAQAECAGGALLERIEPAPLGATLLPPRLIEEPSPIDVADPMAGVRARIALAASGEDGLAWRRRLIGFMDHRLPIPGASLVKIPAGRAMPRHGHEGEELTLVLRGAFEDERGTYQRGDLVFADAAIEHTPRVTADDACVCLIAETGGLKLRTWWGRAIAGWVH